MIYEFLSVAVGLVILVFAGDALVKGAVNLALRLGIPALVVSLTIVAFGTSAPELLVSVQAIIDGAPGLALGNVVGSNTANVLLVLGVPALIAVLRTSAHDTRRDFLYMIGATVLFLALCLTGRLVWWHGIVLLAALAAVLTATFMSSREADVEVEGAEPGLPGWKVAVFLILGLIGLPVGASLLVDGATAIARTYGVSEAVIGLTLVAIGTSLPELATTVMAAIRRHADVALGNVIGSNLFNLLAIMGVAVLVGPVPVDDAFLQKDLWVMGAASLLLVPFVFMGRDITRIWGVALCTLYVGYLGWALA
ncbi:Inner membrane protein YrbG [Jannaschia seosinensis]|uniref:Inner membrane protein YrbG n=1 Tax=Jannaschia seosinensis TaxID=313367 RepID=A0A0M7BAV6_9RHOB|nr:calcium/sodium antiporter [Jannaschia seosinensis]CUH35230.1 Inner membrane protein YrbG [Jannaschia seosinensis]